MNERIREFAVKAGAYISEPNDWKMVDFDTSKIDLEKFAELIVRDCIDCVDGYTKPRTFDTHYDAVEQIKQHFGVENE